MRHLVKAAQLAAIWTIATGAEAQTIAFERLLSEDRNSFRANCGFTVSNLSGTPTVREQSFIVRPRTHFRSVTVINGLGVTTQQIDTTFDTASTLLQQDSGTGDSNCCTAIRRTGAVNFVDAPASVPGGAIVTSNDLDDIFDLPGDIKVVASIGFCSRSGSFTGCARGNELIVLSNFAASTLAHEIGHNTGLCHVATNCTPTCGQAGDCSDCNDPGANNIMYPRFCAGRDRFTAAQCTTFQGSATQ